jgi:hypothetical protein
MQSDATAAHAPRAMENKSKIREPTLPNGPATSPRPGDKPPDAGPRAPPPPGNRPDAVPHQVRGLRAPVTQGSNVGAAPRQHDPGKKSRTNPPQPPDTAPHSATRRTPLCGPRHPRPQNAATRGRPRSAPNTHHSHREALPSRRPGAKRKKSRTNPPNHLSPALNQIMRHGHTARSPGRRRHRRPPAGELDASAGVPTRSP